MSLDSYFKLKHFIAMQPLISDQQTDQLLLQILYITVRVSFRLLTLSDNPADFLFWSIACNTCSIVAGLGLHAKHQ